MTHPKTSVEQAVETYLLTGDYDSMYPAWSGDFISRERRAYADCLRALCQRVKELAGPTSGRESPGIDSVTLTRGRVAPMVFGLFPGAEREAVLGLVERSVRFLTAETIEPVLLEPRWLGTAWDVANLYLGSVGAPLLGIEAPSIVGLSVGTTCIVSAGYFEEDDPFADFVVHEVAHIFHNCKRGVVGLPQTRRRQWLLDIEFRKRETFAYSCEVYGCIARRARSPGDRLALAGEYEQVGRVHDARAAHDEIADIVREACAARNGWRTILARCKGALGLAGEVDSRRLARWERHA